MLKNWKFHIIRNKIIDFPKKAFNAYLQTLSDGAYEFILRKQSKQRTPLQNSYYWAVPIKMISEKTGYYPYEVHGIVKHLFLKPRGYESSTQLDTINFSEILMDEFLAWAQEEFEFENPIPLPNEVYLE